MALNSHPSFDSLLISLKVMFKLGEKVENDV